MIFYTADDDGHTKLAGTQADAKAINKNFTQIDIPTDKTGLMAFVQKLYDDIYDLEHGQAEPFNINQATKADLIDPDPYAHADGSRECRPVEPKPEGYTERAVRFEDEFANMTLALQLHYAALAMENARERL